MTEQPDTKLDGDTVIVPCRDCGAKLLVPAEQQGLSFQCESCWQLSQAANAPLQPATPDVQPTTPDVQPTTPDVQPATSEVRREAVKSAPAPVVSQRKVRQHKLHPVGKEINADSLMSDFWSRKMLLIAGVTIAVHVVIVLGGSIGFIREKLVGTNTEEMTKDEKIIVALGEATAALSKIVEKHGLQLQDLTSRFASGQKIEALKKDKGAGSDKDQKEPSATEPKKPAASSTNEPQRQLSDLEKSLPKASTGPAAPVDKGEDLSGLN